MKTLIRTLIQLALIVWLGGEIFFPVVAGVTFAQLAPNTHAAGQIVGTLLLLLHELGLVSGVVLLALLALAKGWGVFSSPRVLPPMALLVVMVTLTAYSQFGIIPAMERDRKAVGGTIDSVPKSNPSHVDFDRLHHRSTAVEGTVLLLGIGVVGLLGFAESSVKRT